MTNPERLWAYRWDQSRGKSGGCATGLAACEDMAEAQRFADAAMVATTTPDEYVRADVAAAEVAALRAEVVALRSGEFVRAITAERNAYREALEKVVALMAPAQVWEPWAAKEVAKAALATKGVG